MFNKLFGGLAVKAKTTQAVGLFLTHGIMSEKGKQIVVNTPELLANDADVFLKSWMDAYNLAEDEELENWQKMYLIRYILKNCRQQGIEKAYSVAYPVPQDVFDALEKFFDVEILEEHLPGIIKKNPILISDYAIEMLNAFINSPKKPEDIDVYQDALELLDECHREGVDQTFVKIRRETTDGQVLLKVFAQRPKTIQELSVMIREYPLLIHPKFTEGFLKFTESLKNPMMRKNFIARHEFIKDVIASGYAAACAHAQSHPEESMLRETVLIFLLSDTIDDACDLVRKNPCLLLAQSVPVAEAIIQNDFQKQPETAQILRQRLNFLAMCQSQGIDLAYKNLSSLADPKKLEKTLDLFLTGNWSDPESLLMQQPDLLKDGFIRIAKNSIETALKDGQEKLAGRLQKRLQIIEEYKTEQDIKEIRTKALEQLMALIREFIVADVKKAYLLVVENPVLLSGVTQKLMERIADSKKEQDVGFYMIYKTHQNQLRRCKEVGVEQAFAEFQLSADSFLPADVAEKYGEIYNRIEQVNNEIDSDTLLKTSQLEIASAIDVDLPELLRGILEKFYMAQDSREIAMMILEHPILLMDQVIASLRDYLDRRQDPSEKNMLAKKILLLQTCREKGVQATLTPYL